MARRTAEQELARQMEKLKAMGVTINVTPAIGVPPDETRPSSLIAQAAKAAGIYYEQESN